MSDVVLFHHVLGLTDGVRAFAERLATDGHVVHTPDLYGGQVATSLDDGFAIKTRIGDLDAARELVNVVGADRAELYLYEGDSHLFLDSSLPSFDDSATDLVIERSHDFLDRLSSTNPA